MNDYPRFLDEIREAIYAPGSADADLLVQAAAEYAEYCAEVNERLRKAERLLRKGMRAEAIQEAEREPNLLELVTLLDFPELPEWKNMLREWGMVLPPPLLVDIAEQLNEAYAVTQPLRGLLRNHRLFALARAPLPARIKTLRTLCERDSENGGWRDDLEAWEQARIREISGLHGKAYERGDVAALAELWEELNAPGWTVAPPPGLVSAVRRELGEIAARQARKDLELVEMDLSQAYGELNVEAGRAARERWNELAATAALAADDPLMERAFPALQWLAAEDETERRERHFRKTVEALEKAVDDQVPAETLERLYAKALQFEQPLPEVLQHRVERRLAHQETVGRRRHAMVITAIVGALLLIAAGTGFFLWQQMQKSRLEVARSTVARLLSEGRYEEAAAFIDGLPEPLRSEETLREARLTIEGQLGEEADRRAAFERLLAQAEESPTQDAVRRLEGLARTETERQQAAEIRAKLTGLERLRQQEVDEQYQEDLAAAEDRLDELRHDPAPHVGDVEALIAEIKVLLEGRPGVSRSLLAQAEPLLVRAEALRDEVRQTQRTTAQRQQVFAAVGNPSRYRDALLAFAEANPTSRESAAYRDVAEEAPLWDALDRWVTLYRLPAFREPAKATPATARATLAQAQAVEAHAAGFPLAVTWQQYQPYFAAIARREPEGGVPLAAHIVHLLDDPLIHNVEMVVSRNRRYYTAASSPAGTPAGSLRQFVVEYFEDFSLRPKTIGLMPDTISYRGKSPQSQLAERLREIHRGLTHANWESAFYQMLRQVKQAHQQEPAIEPILQYLLLRNILRVACEGSEPMAQAFRRELERLEGADVDDHVNWLNPASDEATAVRTLARTAVSTGPDYEALAHDAARRLREFHRPVAIQYEWIGALSRELSGDWRIAPAPASSLHGEVYVVFPRSGSAQPQFEQIGFIARGQLTLGTVSSLALREGRPVYLKAANSP